MCLYLLVDGGPRCRRAVRAALVHYNMVEEVQGFGEALVQIPKRA
jgi:selenocysteine lyase/cysteine desulfurase